DHLVVAPERAVHQHAGGAVHGPPDRLVHGPETGRVERAAARVLVRDDERHVVPRHGGFAIGGVWGRLAGDGQGAPAHAGYPLHGEVGAVEAHAVALDTAVVGQHLDDRIAPRQVGVHGVGAPEVPWAGRFTQHVETGRVVHLPIHEHDGPDGGVAWGARRLKILVGAHLGEYVRRGVDQRPGLPRLAGSHGDGRLCSAARAQRSPAQPGAVAAVAVPLRIAAAGRRAEHA